MLADVEVQKHIPVVLMGTIMFIQEEGGIHTLERYPSGVATFIHKNFAHAVGEGANERQVYGLVYVRLSETPEDIEIYAAKLSAEIETEL